MQTNFHPDLLVQQSFRDSEKIIQTCVHCGLCTGTCPTYLLLGDELDSPRGRIYLIKQMFEDKAPATEAVVKHLDRCLTCLACMTTCPSGVHYQHLIDHTRGYIEHTYRRPLKDRFLRWMLSIMVPNPDLFRWGMIGLWLTRPFLFFLPSSFRAMLRLVPKRLPNPSAFDRAGTYAVKGRGARYRVALHRGCAQSALAPQITEAAIRLLNRHDVEVVVLDVGCCGSLVHHLGKESQALRQAKAVIDTVWSETKEGGGRGIDALVLTASGCGITVKDYGFMLREDPQYTQKAQHVARLTLDITQFCEKLDLKPMRQTGQTLAYHSACSMQHGLQVRLEPKLLLKGAGFVVKDIPEGHICCGSAGVYNILQDSIALRLRDRKISNIQKVQPDIIAAGNLGCMTQISSGVSVPVVHTLELLDWATGGPKPQALS